MNGKEFLLSIYYWGTLPMRRYRARQRALRKTEPISILFYHRIADLHPNDWTMSTRCFERQIKWLIRHFDVVSLAEAQSRIASGANQRPTACITFDDGYAENLDFAIPLLLHHKLPFTYFVATSFVLQQRPFPHDVARGQALPPNSPDDLRMMSAQGVEIGAHTRSHIDLGLELSTDQLRHEIEGSKHDLEQLLERNVRYLAFPFGHPQNMANAAIRMAAESGFDGICSAYGAYNLPGDDPFHLRRFHGDSEMIRFKNWLTIDPRKLDRKDPIAVRNFHQASKLSIAHEARLEVGAEL